MHTRILETLHLALAARSIYFYIILNHADFSSDEKPVW